MFKTISAALLAVSVLAAPAFASSAEPAPLIKAPVKASVLNANARMGRHHHMHMRHHRHYRHHGMGMLKAHTKISFKRTSHADSRRG